MFRSSQHRVLSDITAVAITVTITVAPTRRVPVVAVDASAPANSWAGSYKHSGGCDQMLCCCPDTVTITASGPTLRVEAALRSKSTQCPSIDVVVPAPANSKVDLDDYNHPITVTRTSTGLHIENRAMPWCTTTMVASSGSTLPVSVPVLAGAAAGAAVVIGVVAVVIVVICRRKRRVRTAKTEAAPPPPANA